MKGGGLWAGQHTQAAGQSGLLGPGQSDWQHKVAQRALGSGSQGRLKTGGARAGEGDTTD